MENQKYVLASVIDDIKCDIKRYITKSEIESETSNINYIKILFTYPIIFVIINYRIKYWANIHLRLKRYILLKYFISFMFYICKYLSVVFYKIEIGEFSTIGPGLFLSKRGHIIIGAESIGTHCTLEHNITIGLGLKRGSLKGSLPVIGDNVYVGNNSIIYGSIHVGSGSTIHEQTVLTKNIPENTHVSGNPAKIIQL